MVLFLIFFILPKKGESMTIEMWIGLGPRSRIGLTNLGPNHMFRMYVGPIYVYAVRRNGLPENLINLAR